MTQRRGWGEIVWNANDLRVVDNVERGSASLQPPLRWRQGQACQFTTIAIPLIDFADVLTVCLSLTPTSHTHDPPISYQFQRRKQLWQLQRNSPLHSPGQWQAFTSRLRNTSVTLLKRSRRRPPFLPVRNRAKRSCIGCHLFLLFRLVTHVSHWCNSSDTSAKTTRGRMSL